MTDERRRAARLKSSARVLWAVVGSDSFQVDRMRDVSGTGARIATDALPKVGAEIRFEALDDDGQRLCVGLARVVWVDPSAGMGVAFLALGVDPKVVEVLIAADTASRERRPPQLPDGVAGAPPLPTRAPAKRAPLPREEAEDDVEAQIEPLQMRPKGLIVGIDLGTTNTCVSYLVDGRPVVIPSRTGKNTVPSMITFEEDGSFHVGQRAADRQILFPLQTVYGSKRLLGRTYRADVAAEMQARFAFPLAEAEGQRFGVSLGKRVVSMDEIATRILEEVRATAEAALETKIEAAVITVPAYFSEVQREAVRRAAARANLVVHRIVNEPTAAAIAYGKKQHDEARIAVWDFGGGTFDISVVDVSEGQIEVVATGGDCFLGGSDFDDAVAAWILGEFQRIEAIELEPSPQQISRLREAAEHAKCSLSVQTEYLVELPELTRDPRRDLRVEVTRDDFAEITRPLVERTIAITQRVLADAGLSPSDIDDVVLVGGSTRVPEVQHAVATFFKRRPSKRINPDEAVALGAALLAGEIGSVDAPTLLDILPMSVGRAVSGMRFEPVVPRATRLPLEREVTVEADLSGAVTLPLFQGESADVAQNEYICSAVVEDPVLQNGGTVVFRLGFDEACVMSVEARQEKTGRPLAVRLDRARPLQEILNELGQFQGPPPVVWKLPESRLSRVLGKLFKLFG